MLSPEVSKLCGDLGRALSQFSIALWVLWMQAPLVFTARFFWDCLSGAGLKSWGAQCGIKPFLPQGEVPGFYFPSDCGSPRRGYGL